MRPRKSLVFPFLLLAILAFSLFGCSSLFQPVLPGVTNYAEAFEYGGRRYHFQIFYGRRDKREQLGKTEDGDPVYSYNGTTDFLEVEGSDNTSTFWAEGCSIPTVGTLTAVLVDPGLRGGRDLPLDAPEELSLLKELLSLEEDPITCTMNINDGHSLYSIYDNCDLSCPENFSGFLISLGEGWLYVPPRFQEDLFWLEDFSAAEVHAIPITDPELNQKLTESKLTEGIRP